MNKMKFKKAALALGSLAILGAASQASAFPQFTINPNGVNAGDTASSAIIVDNGSGTASELLTPVSATDFTGTGLLLVSDFNLGLTPKFSPSLSGAAPFNIYITFTVQAHLVSGSLGQPGSQYVLPMLNFTLYSDPHNNDTFTAASATSTTATAPSVTGTGDDIVLGSGSIISGAAAINSDSVSTGGALNSTETFALTNAGMQFFVAPVPFYEMVIDEFNNTTVQQGPGGTLALSGGTGDIKFARVPEPDSLALFGIAAVAAGLAAKRRRKA